MKLLVTVNISKGFEKWTQMSKELAPEAEKNGMKMRQNQRQLQRKM